jgi:hypothetical protein
MQNIDAKKPRSIGQELQNWLLRNGIDVTHALFVPAVDLAFKNSMRNRSQDSVNRRETSSIPARPSCDVGSEMASIAT